MIHSGKADKGQRGTRKRWVRRSVAVVGLIAVIGIIWLYAAQKNNLKALYLAMTSDADTLEQKQVEEEKRQEDILQQYGLEKPDSSQAQEIDESDENAANPPQGNPPSSGGAETSQESDQDANSLQAELQGYINQLYQVEANYRQVLNGVVQSAKSEFWALPKDQQVQEKKMQIVKSKMNDLIAQENACDAQVETILSNIEDVLKRQGKSNDLVNSIRSYYEESKASWKAAKMTELYS